VLERRGVEGAHVGAYADLVEPDRRTLHFVPGGLAAGTLHPNDAVAFQSALIADAVLVDTVPEELCSRFNRLSTKHVRGVSDYANFAEVCNLAIGMYEPALQMRFLEFYSGRDIPFTERDGSPAPLRVDHYDRVYRHVSPTKGKRIHSADGSAWFNGTLDGLLSWARMEGLLRGQRARGHERIIRRLRNDISQGGGYQLETPVTSVLEIRDLAEFINQLWGSATPDGRVYPAPVAREVLALGWDSAGRMTLVRAATLTTDDSDQAMQWILLRGGLHDREWAQFDSRYLTTALPTSYLWGSGTAADALEWISTHQPTPDTVDTVDQLMLIRHHRNDLYLPQRPEIAAALSPRDQTGRWYLMLADQPMAAFICVRARINRDPGHLGDCQCPTRRLARGTWQKMRHRLSELQPSLVPTLPPDVRVEDSWRMPKRVTKVNQIAT
jgi:hypothetical protein